MTDTPQGRLETNEVTAEIRTFDPDKPFTTRDGRKIVDFRDNYYPGVYSGRPDDVLFKFDLFTWDRRGKFLSMYGPKPALDLVNVVTEPHRNDVMRENITDRQIDLVNFTGCSCSGCVAVREEGSRRNEIEEHRKASIINAIPMTDEERSGVEKIAQWMDRCNWKREARNVRYAAGLPQRFGCGPDYKPESIS